MQIDEKAREQVALIIQNAIAEHCSIDAIEMEIDGAGPASFKAADRILAYESAKQKGEAEGWRPIESAPKDGTNILLAHARAVFDGYWDVYANGWVDDVTDLYEDKITYQATHWRPLPEPPTMLSAGGEDA